jgi:NAD(P)-dependent dehydrogenase (short-subunit alcohol dehydrogenase family)
MSTLLDKTIVVTGASGNLGDATVRALLARGARVIGLDRDDTRPRVAFADAVAAGKVSLLRVDLTSAASVEEAFEAALGDRAPDGLVATVGGYKGGVSLLEGDADDWEAMWRINVATAVHASRAAGRRMAAAGAGSIVHVASLAALSGGAGQIAYSAAKSAVLRLTEGLAEELKPKRVRVNAVLPGTMDTPQNRAWMSPDAATLAVDPLAVADAIAFLLSPEARAVTGAALRVTGFQ